MLFFLGRDFGSFLFFLGRDLGYLFFQVKFVFLSFFFLVKILYSFFFSWSKACFLFLFSLKSFINSHLREGKFKKLGLSNYSSWQVSRCMEICRREGWVAPSVYQAQEKAYIERIICSFIFENLQFSYDRMNLYKLQCPPVCLKEGFGAF